jgi:hypothetical protein
MIPDYESFEIVTKQLVAPVHRRVQGTLTGRRRSAAGREQSEGVAEAGGYLLHRQHLRPSSRELYGQGNAVQPVADVGHRRRVLLCELEARFNRRSPLYEQAG